MASSVGDPPPPGPPGHRHRRPHGRAPAHAGPLPRAGGALLDHPGAPPPGPALRGHRPGLARPDPRGAGRHPDPRAARGGAPRPAGPSTWPPPCSPSCSTSAWTRSGIDFGVVYPSLGLVFLHTDGRAVPAGRLPGPQPVQRRDLRPAGRPPDPGGRHPHAHPRGGGGRAGVRRHRARVQGGGLRRLRAAALRRPGRQRPRGVPLRLLARPVRHRLGLRLRPGVGQGPGARRVHRLPLGLHRDDPVPVDLPATCPTTCRCWPRASSRWPSRSSSAG